MTRTPSTRPGGAPAPRFVLLLALVTCALAGAQTPPPEPARPFDLKEPPAPPKQFGEHDLSTLDGDTLRANAFRMFEEGDLEDAIALQYWGVMAKEGGGDGRYNLACFYSRAGKADAAVYWLQRAAKEEGVDAHWAREDPDFEPLHADPRWARLVEHLDAWNAWWEKSGLKVTLLVLPQGYTKDRPIAAVVGLHGMGSHPDDFASAEDYQEHADALGVAFVGVSGTLPRGPAGFVWAEDPVADRARVDAALAEVADRVKVAPGAVVLIGFSQGAQTAAELAARDPAAFAGAIVLSPGGREDPRVGQVSKTPAHARAGFVVRVGAGEHEGNVEAARVYADALRALGARVDHHAYPDMDEHTFPPDFAEKLGEWVVHVLGDRRPAR